MSVSDFLRANPNTEQCGNLSLIDTNKATCKTTNYLVPASVTFWTISLQAGTSEYRVHRVPKYGNVSSSAANSNGGVLPALYLIPNITLDGEGTSDIPYTIIS